MRWKEAIALQPGTLISLLGNPGWGPKILLRSEVFQFEDDLGEELVWLLWGSPDSDAARLQCKYFVKGDDYSNLRLLSFQALDSDEIG